MIRIVVTQIVLFLLPFVVFLVYRATTEGWATAWVSARARRFTLVLAGGLLAIAGFVWSALDHGVDEGVYVPAQYRDGELVPGGFRPRE